MKYHICVKVKDDQRFISGPRLDGGFSISSSAVLFSWNDARSAYFWACSNPLFTFVSLVAVPETHFD